MRLAENKFFLIVISLVVIFVIGALIFSFTRPEEKTPQAEELLEYPDNLLEGVIVSLSVEEPKTLVIEADVSKIIPDSEKMEKTIKIEDDTELILHEVSPEADSVIELSELKPGDFVLVATTESTRDEILTRDTFTALKITKIRTVE